MAMFILLVALYFAPSLIARSGRRTSVFVLNLFLGWTLIGWVIALYLGVKSHEAGIAVR